ncbi:hypothetical protein ACJ41O_006645 [Fusarium nematophilum]
MGFKVVIVGGSVTGLSVANMLEKFDIDYVLLEAYPHIAPQIGASLGLLPNGFRILDQLGCFEPVLDVAGVGYPSIFIDRQMFLQILYDSLQHKDRVLTNRRVTRLELIPGGVEAHAHDGSVYKGDIVVGADGIHSAVRDEMWRLGMEMSPGYFPQDETSRVPVSTRCIFGISKRPDGLRPRGQHMAHGDGYMYLVIAAPGDRTYWFLFEALPETKYGKDIPKYTKDDEAELAKGRHDDHITQDVRFGDLYDRKLMSTLVPLEEYVFERWHYQRIVTIGDSAHKIDPSSGQGGNGAIESAALLVNALTRQLRQTTQGLSEMQVVDALAEVHELRHERARRLVDQAHLFQKFICSRHPASPFVINHLLPTLGPYFFLDVAIPICIEATHLENLPIPKRPRFVPFQDELPARPIKGAFARRGPWLLASGALGLLTFAASKEPSTTAAAGFVHSNLRQWGAGGLLTRLTGHSMESHLVMGLAPTLVSWLAESHRYGNSLNPLSWASVYSLVYGFIGPKSVTPLFCLSSVLFPNRSTTNRPVNPGVAQSILPAVALGYVLPTLVALVPVEDAEPSRRIVLLWQVAPLLCAALTRGFAALRAPIVKKPETQEDAKKIEDLPAGYADESELEQYENKDVTPLKVAYSSALAICAAGSFMAKIASAHWAPSGLSQVLPLGEHANTAAAASCLVYALYIGWDLRSLGYVGTKQALLGSLASVAALGLGGAGAAIGVVSYWQEHVIAGLSF